MKNLKILMNEKCFRKKIDISMQFCTVSLCKFQGKSFVSCKTDHCLGEKVVTGLSAFLLSLPALHYLLNSFLCANDMPGKMKMISHVEKKSGFLKTEN